MSFSNSNLIWIDLEMTGLDTQNDVIIEIATVISDKDLNIIADGPVFAISQPDELMDGMDAWNTRQHGNSGLTQRVKNSDINCATAEKLTIDFLKKYVGKGKSPMCGNSICQDRRFMARLMPELENYFHYRNLDVSTLKEISSRWYPDLQKGFSKQSKHLALEDVYDSINELVYYREMILQSPCVVADKLEQKLLQIKIDKNSPDSEEE